LALFVKHSLHYKGVPIPETPFSVSKTSVACSLPSLVNARSIGCIICDLLFRLVWVRLMKKRVNGFRLKATYWIKPPSVRRLMT